MAQGGGPARLWGLRGGERLTSHRSPCAQPQDRGTGPAGSEASYRRALGVLGPLLRRRFYMGRHGSPQLGRAGTCTLGLPGLGGVRAE